jgi:hypothetical protein
VVDAKSDIVVPTKESRDRKAISSRSAFPLGYTDLRDCDTLLKNDCNTIVINDCNTTVIDRQRVVQRAMSPLRLGSSFSHSVMTAFASACVMSCSFGTPVAGI